MSAAFSIKIDGLAALERRLRELPDRIAKNALGGSVYAGAKVIRDEARLRAPVYTGKVSRGHPPPGTLKRSIILKHIREQSGRERQTYFVTVRKGKRYRNQGKKKNLSQDAFYWWWVEFGGVRHTARFKGAYSDYALKGKQRKTGIALRRRQRTGLPSIARPFMRPAFESKKISAAMAMKAYLSDRIADEIRKLGGK